MKKCKSLFLAVLFLIIGISMFSQSSTKGLVTDKITSNNPREQNPLGINFSLGSPVFIASLSIDYFISSTINLEVGGGLIGVYGGVKYHFQGNKDKNWTPYTGVYLVGIPTITFLFNTTNSHMDIYVPLGIQYIGNGGFTFAFEGAASYSNSRDNKLLPYGALKLGFHF